MPFRWRAAAVSGAADRMWASNPSASSRRPPSRNSLAIFSNSSIGTGTCSVRGGSSGGNVLIIVFTALFQGVAETIHHRLHDWDHRLKMPQIIAITEPRSVMELLLYLRVTRSLGQPRVVLNAHATLLERLANEVQHVARTRGAR